MTRTPPDDLLRRVERLEAIEEVKRLHNVYGYYMDLLLYDQVAPLFADDCEIRFMGGIYRGAAGAHRLFIGNLGSTFTASQNAPQRGRMGEHIMLQEVITVADDARSAKARLRHLLKAGLHMSVQGVEPEVRGGVQFDQWIEGGIYENEYVLVDGVWKFRKVDYQIEYFATVDGGWANTPEGYEPWFTRTYPADPLGPDELIDPKPRLWPDRVVVPFHYPNPVTDQDVVVDTSMAIETR
ncbi:nuclear transport factor 2 family protein [Leifsonia sp. NPDC058194]|uniref:nuclear transport factor 2 family protein n=1 Tax=Leifsonia sp. NPDC058194 TaxID=3346374 RepID=UPI0036DBC276